MKHLADATRAWSGKLAQTRRGATHSVIVVADADAHPCIALSTNDEYSLLNPDEARALAYALIRLARDAREPKQ